MTCIEQLAQRLAGLEIEKLPRDVVEAARLRLFDTAATFVIGAALPEGQLMRTLSDLHSLEDRIRYMAATIRCTEIDDIHIGSCTTVGSVVVPVALLGDADERRVVCSLVAGYQAMTALGQAVDGAHCVYEGIWPTYLTAPFAAAAVAAQLAELDAEQTGHALAIAATRCVGMTGQLRGPQTSRWYTVGSAASEGYRAAHAASRGMQGDPGVLERGFGRATGTSFDATAFQTPGWTILDIDTKPFRVGRQALSAIEAYQALGSPEQVSQLRVWLPRQVIGLVERAGMHDQFPRPLSVCDDPRLTALYPEHWGARVEVTHPDGSTDSREVLDPRGSAKAGPFGWPELLDKHRGLGAGDWLEPLGDLCRDFGPRARSREVRRLIGLE